MNQALADTVTPEEVLDEMERRILLVDSTPFQRNTKEVWNKARAPLTSMHESHSKAHLLFSASLEDAPSSRLTRHVSYHSVDVSLRIRVMFLFHCRKTTQHSADEKLAIKAARYINKTLMNDWELGNIYLDNLFRPGALVSGEYLPVSMFFTVTADISL